MTSPLPPTVPLTTELSTLEASCTGRILRAADPRVAAYLGGPDDRGYDGAAVVVLADCVHDVGAAVRFAARAGAPTVVVGGTRPTAAVAADAVVIVVDAIAGVDVDPVTATARVGIGASWSTLHEAASALGLTVPAASAHHTTVGPALANGLTGVGDGDGQLLEAVVAAQLIDASGRARRRADATGATLLARAHDEGQIVTAVDLRLR